MWINADPLPGAVVCNIGEMWETWTAGLYRSTLHRVIHRSSNYRVSYAVSFSLHARPHPNRVPFFFEPNFDAVVKPLDAALRIKATNSKSAGDVESKFPPMVYGEFLKSKVGANFSEESQQRERY